MPGVRVAEENGAGRVEAMSTPMRTIVLDASGWRDEDDFYNAFLKAVGSPDWHGHNLDALSDSIRETDINQINLPYNVVIENQRLAGKGVATIIKRFTGLVRLLASRGYSIDIEIRN